MSAVEDDGWRNWSGAIHCPGQGLERPADSAALCALVDGLGAGERIRAVGSGHSFVPFWAPGDRLVDLGAFTGLRGAAEGEGGDVAVVGAGTPIHVLGPLLAAAGRALANQGDIDRQTLAGAISTGTHGTGRGLGSLSSMVSHLVLVDGTGTERRIAGEALPAARVSLGLFGIITEIGIRTVPLYGLHERNHRESVQSCLEALEARFEAHRHHEFWWVPSEDLCIAKTLDAIEVPQASRTDEIAFGADGERWGAAWEVFPSARDARFNEMEYAVPAAAGPDCFRALRTAMLDAFPKLPWPIEYRIVAGDDGWLSPTAGVEVAAISVHQDARRDPAPLFDLAEPILRAHGGRPHWGKVQRLAATELADLYPRLGDFAETRRRLDPRDRFLGPWLRTLLPGA